MPIQIVDPITFPDWDDQISRLPGCTIFHTSHWARVLCDSYGYSPHYFTLLDQNSITACLPVMEVDSFITGRRGVSLPFTDFCEPLISSQNQFHILFSEAVEFGKKRKWKSLELRGGPAYLDKHPPSSQYYHHTLKLYQSDSIVEFSHLFSSFRDSTRRNIKKAQKDGACVEIQTTEQAVRQFYRLNQLTRKEHGLPPQPYLFFKNVYEHIISQGHGFIVLAYAKNVPIAGSVYFRFGHAAVYKYGASDKKHQELRANNLVMWEAIKRLADHGCETMSFGRTDLDHNGLRRFKLSWGTMEEPMNYFKYDLKASSFVSNEIDSVNSLATKVFVHTPLPLLRAFGSLMYRHMG